MARDPAPQAQPERLRSFCSRRLPFQGAERPACLAEPRSACCAAGALEVAPPVTAQPAPGPPLTAGSGGAGQTRGCGCSLAGHGAAVTHWPGPGLPSVTHFWSRSRVRAWALHLQGGLGLGCDAHREQPCAMSSATRSGASPSLDSAMGGFGRPRAGPCSGPGGPRVCRRLRLWPACPGPTVKTSGLIQALCPFQGASSDPSLPGRHNSLPVPSASWREAGVNAFTAQGALQEEERGRKRAQRG